MPRIFDNINLKLLPDLQHMHHGAEKVTYEWEGKLINDYIVYESICLEKETAMRSTAMLFIDARGQKMNGYFVATSSGLRAPLRTWVGYAMLTKKA